MRLVVGSDARPAQQAACPTKVWVAPGFAPPGEGSPPPQGGDTHQTPDFGWGAARPGLHMVWGIPTLAADFP